jgi:hypothetical protein
VDGCGTEKARVGCEEDVKKCTVNDQKEQGWIIVGRGGEGRPEEDG